MKRQFRDEEAEFTEGKILILLLVLPTCLFLRVSALKQCPLLLETLGCGRGRVTADFPDFSVTTNFYLERRASTLNPKFTHTRIYLS